MAQYYLSADPCRTVRVRIAGERAFITVKGRTCGCARGEWEYGIPVGDAREMSGLCGGHGIEKIRWIVPYAGHTWEVDEFGGRHRGTVIAEIELKTEDETFDIPPFVGDEVTGDPRYYNSVMASPG